MSKYTGKPVTVAASANEVFAKISNLGQYKEQVESLPEEYRAKLAGVEFGADSVSMDAPGVGRLTFAIDKVVEPTSIRLKAVSSPVPLSIGVNLAENGPAETIVTPDIDIDIPAMLRPFIGGKIQEAADKFGEVFTTIFAPKA